ncbi:PEP-CTERM putative exosortase interaction domain-containing protein [Cylindrospermum stagnale PCC 7417]|uniref:PEP-CTERM putative exosortase interaction domain-containing protein n=1 Tax=Cylindrospermum stagnale PCC 7417 TaxID=56107 RepID=K9WZB8_9NOST|nr:lectin-like protein [Cylindrospermum stagnale]AFZ25710.1 PEP-CTERM putative exosortase interaction domain-containing protein [Cylindrospermum stagnale PCC 7417]
MKLTCLNPLWVKKLSIVTATAAAMTLGIGSAASAATFTNPSNGHQYFLTTTDSWTGAQSQAVAAGGNLVTINDAAENNWLVSTFGGVERLWIGFTDVVQEGAFKWISGQPVTYTNWAPGEPNNFAGSEDYAFTNWNIAGIWNDSSGGFGGNRKLGGIVEVEPSKSVPEPATLGGILLVGTVSMFLKKKKLAAA